MKRFCLSLLVAFCAFSLFSCADLQQAKLYYSSAKYDKAAGELKPLIRKDFPEAYYLMGRMILEGDLKRYTEEDGVKLLKKAYELGYYKAAKELGFFYVRKNNIKKALIWLERAARYGDITARDQLLRIKLSISRLKPSVLKKLLAEARHSPTIYGVIGDYYSSLGDTQKAVEFYGMAYRNGVVDSGLKLARIYVSEGRYKRAISLLEDAYKKYKEKRAALMIGKIYEKIGRDLHLPYCPVTHFKEAEPFFEAKLELRKRREVYYRKALVWYRRAFPLDEAKYRYLRIDWIMKNNPCGNYFKILEFVKKGVRVALSDIKRLYYGGRCRLPYGSKVSQEQNKLGLGRKLLSTATGTAKSPAARYFEEGVQLLSYNRARAIEYLEKACMFGSVASEIRLALINKDKNPKLAAAVLYYYASELHIPRAMLALAKLYFSAGKNKKALYWLNRAAKEYKYTPARRYLAIYLLAHNRQKEAIEYLLQLEKEKYCFASILLGAVYEGYYGTFKVNLKKAFFHYRVALTNECPEAYFRLARLYLFTGRLKRALELAKRYAVLRSNQIKAFVLLFRIEEALNNMKAASYYMRIAIGKGYLPSPGELERLFPYLSEDILLSGKIRWITYEVVGKKMADYNFDASFCMAYEAAMRSVPKAASTVFVLGTTAKTYQQGIFVRRVGEDATLCQRYLSTHGALIRKMIGELQKRLLVLYKESQREQ